MRFYTVSFIANVVEKSGAFIYSATASEIFRLCFLTVVPTTSLMASMNSLLTTGIGYDFRLRFRSVRSRVFQ